MRMCLFVSTAVDSDEDVQQGDTKHDDLTGALPWSSSTLDSTTNYIYIPSGYD